EEAQQIAIVRRSRRYRQPVDRAAAESPFELRLSLKRAPRDFCPPQIDETRFATFGVDEARETAIGESLLARIADRDRDQIVFAIESLERRLECRVHEIGEQDDHG